MSAGGPQLLLGAATGFCYLLGAACWIVNALWSGWPSGHPDLDSYLVGFTAVFGALLFLLGAMCQLWESLNSTARHSPPAFTLLPSSCTMGPWLLNPSQHSGSMTAGSFSLCIDRHPSALQRHGSAASLAGLSADSEVQLSDLGGSPRTLLRGDSAASQGLPTDMDAAPCLRMGSLAGAHTLLITPETHQSHHHSSSQQQKQQDEDCTRLPACGQLHAAAPAGEAAAEGDSTALIGDPLADTKTACGHAASRLARQLQRRASRGSSGFQATACCSPSPNSSSSSPGGSPRPLKAARATKATRPLQQPGWVWWEWRPHDLTFMAAFVQVVGTTIFAAACVCGFPGVLPTNYAAGDWILWDALFWAPFLAGSCLFITSSLLSLRGCQGSWWRTKPRHTAWWMHVANTVGSIGFWLCSFFGFFAHPAEKYQRWGMAFSCLWGSCCFAVAAYLQLLLACSARAS